MGFELGGGHEKMALKRGSRKSKEKIVGFSGFKGGSPKISFQNAKTSVSEFRGSSNFPGELACPRTPYYPSKMQKCIKAYQIECFFREKNNKLS